MGRNVTDYINSSSISKVFERVQVAWKSSKVSGLAMFKTALADAYNAGWFAMMTFKKEKTASLDDASVKLTSGYLPSSFGDNEVCKTAIDSVIERVKLVSRNNVLNVGYEKTLRDPICDILKTVYALGLTSGFEIANDPELKELYLACSDRFTTIE